MGASYVQGSFLGGRWSPTAQGRTADQNYKSALNVCTNFYPLESGAATRRQAFARLGNTRGGQRAVLRQFDFTTAQPFQMEFTVGFLRFWQGLGLVQEADGPVNVAYIDTASPANVYLVQPIPAAWEADDTVIFDIASVPCSTTQLCGRQFTIGAVNTTNNSFTLYDAITGDPVDGATVAFTYSAAADTVAKVFELVTPYAQADLDLLRTVQCSGLALDGQTQNSVLVLHNVYQPQNVTPASGNTPFAIAPPQFQDGPYFDLNNTSTTLTLSATSGTVNVTASGTNGINNGQGFLASDVGRHIRFECAPPAWSSSVTYAKNAVVLGSDNNIYQSLLGANINHDPTLDTGTNWEITSQVVQWVWMIVQTLVSTTEVTATLYDVNKTILGQTLPAGTALSTTATTNWRLGSYGGSTAWPSCGTYHEGRLWLSGAVPNRFDASLSNYPFIFSPTYSDGTVADNNGISETLNATENNTIFWMLSQDQGILCGTLGREWLIFSSELQDAITPTTITAKAVSTYGCAQVDPVLASVVVFVQRQQRRTLAHAPLTGGRFFADNLNELADDISESGFAELRWQQEPNLTVWARRNDGVLVGSTFQKMPLYSAYQSKNGSFTAWHEHAHGQGRLFESISGGPAPGGLSDALYAVTNNPASAASDYNVRQVEILTPLFDDSLPDWAAQFTDGAGTPCCAVQRAIANGDSFDGIQFYGYTNLVGQTIQPVVGGLDLGDLVVASDGSVSVAYLSDPEKAFTLAFWQAYNDGTDYGSQNATVSYTQEIPGASPPFPTGNFGSYSDAGNKYGSADLSVAQDRVIGFNGTGSTFDIFKYSDFSLVSSTPYSSADFSSYTFIAQRTGCACLSQDGYVYTEALLSGTGGVIKINPATSAISYIATTGEGGANPDVFSLVPFAVGGVNFIVATGSTSVSSVRRLQILATDVLTWLTNGTTAEFNVDEATAYACVCSGGNLFALGLPSGTYSSGETFGVYRMGVGANLSVGFYPLAKIAPSFIDPTWTTFAGGSVQPPVACADGTMLFGVACTDSVTNTAYFVKYNPFTNTIVWKTPVAHGVMTPGVTAAKTVWNSSYAWFSAEVSLQQFALSTGALTATTWNQIFNGSGTVPAYFNEADGSLTVFNAAASWSNPKPTPQGAYSQANETSTISSGRLTRIFLGLNGQPSSQTIQYEIPATGGFTYTSQLQLLRPDFGQDIGNRNGPPFGKRRRNHWWAALLHRARKVFIGTDFAATLKAAALVTPPVSQTLTAPALFSGVATDTLVDEYTFDGQIALQVNRPYPCLVAEMGGYVVGEDK